jgi:hypothetical protein
MQVLTDESSTKPGNAAFEAEKASTKPPKTDAFVEADITIIIYDKSLSLPQAYLGMKLVIAPVSVSG